MSWLLTNNRLEKVPFVSVPHTSSNRLLLSNQDKGCTPSVAHSLALPLGPALLNLWTEMWDLNIINSNFLWDFLSSFQDNTYYHCMNISCHMNISKGYKKTILDNHFQAFLQTQNLPIAIPEVITIHV